MSLHPSLKYRMRLPDSILAPSGRRDAEPYVTPIMSPHSEVTLHGARNSATPVQPIDDTPRVPRGMETNEGPPVTPAAAAPDETVNLPPGYRMRWTDEQERFVARTLVELDGPGVLPDVLFDALVSEYTRHYGERTTQAMTSQLRKMAKDPAFKYAWASINTAIKAYSPKESVSYTGWTTDEQKTLLGSCVLQPTAKAAMAMYCAAYPSRTLTAVRARLNHLKGILVRSADGVSPHKVLHANMTMVVRAIDATHNIVGFNPRSGGAEAAEHVKAVPLIGRGEVPAWLAINDGAIRVPPGFAAPAAKAAEPVRVEPMLPPPPSIPVAAAVRPVEAPGDAMARLLAVRGLFSDTAILDALTKLQAGP